MKEDTFNLLSQSSATCCKVARTNGSFLKINVYLNVFLPVIIHYIPGALLIYHV